MTTPLLCFVNIPGVRGSAPGCSHEADGLDI